MLNPWQSMNQSVQRLGAVNFMQRYWLAAAESFLVAVVGMLLSATPLIAAHGVSIDGVLKYPPGFTRFAYTSDKAVKGG